MANPIRLFLVLWKLFSFASYFFADNTRTRTVRSTPGPEGELLLSSELVIVLTSTVRIQIEILLISMLAHTCTCKWCRYMYMHLHVYARTDLHVLMLSLSSTSITQFLPLFRSLGSYASMHKDCESLCDCTSKIRRCLTFKNFMPVTCTCSW